VDDDGPPMGLSEDEAYDPSFWVRPVLALSALALGGMVLVTASLGIALVTGDVATVKAWDFWGNTDALGVAWLVAASLMAPGIALLLRRSDDSLPLLLLGVMVFEGTMLWGIIRFEGVGGPAFLLLFMLIPFLALAILQLDEVRRWVFHSAQADDGTGGSLERVI
jgi:hypothetical protein